MKTFPILLFSLLLLFSCSKTKVTSKQNPKKGIQLLKKTTKKITTPVKQRKVVYKPALFLPKKYLSTDMTMYLTVEVNIQKDGHVLNAKMVRTSGQPELDRLLMENAKKYRFEKLTKDSITTGHLTFVLKSKP